MCSLLYIQATDNGTEPLNSTSSLEIRLVDANDNAPVFERAEYNASIAENSLPGTEVSKPCMQYHLLLQAW